ncbi:MAG: hypothetical protein KKC14_17330 [Alphaproteobacteria bacterium]|nr:hypothetical protein [Alphaproteobacteria bacterium]
MRLALASLIAIGAVSTTALAQEQTAPAPAVAMPAATMPAAPAQMPMPAPGPADPSIPVVAAPPAPAPVETYVEPVRPPPSTDPTALQVLSVLDRICKPAVVGGDFDALAKAAGLKQKKKMWTLDLGKPYSIVLDNPGSNKNVCTLTLQYAQGDAQAQALATALHDWASWENSPQLRLIRNDQTVSSDYRRFTVSWDDAWANGHAGLVYMRLKKLDETSVGKNYEQAQVLYSTTSR